MHMMRPVDLTLEEQETITVSKKPTTVFTAIRTIRMTEQAAVHVKNLDMFVTVQLFKDSQAVISLGKLCEEHGYSYEWREGQSPNLIEDCNHNSLPIGQFRSTCQNKDEIISVSASCSAETSRSSAWGTNCGKRRRVIDCKICLEG